MRPKKDPHALTCAVQSEQSERAHQRKSQEYYPVIYYFRLFFVFGALHRPGGTTGVNRMKGESPPREMLPLSRHRRQPPTDTE